MMQNHQPKNQKAEKHTQNSPAKNQKLINQQKQTESKTGV